MNALTDLQKTSWLEIVWALVLVQGAILTMSAVEIFVVNVASGFVVALGLTLTAAAATLTLLTARGLRRSKRWARRVTLFGEWFVIVFAVLDVVATLFLGGSLPGLVSLTVGLVVPVTVLVFMRRLKSLFAPQPSATTSGPSDKAVPTDDPVLGTVMS
jgi:hypothetical protein